MACVESCKVVIEKFNPQTNHMQDRAVKASTTVKASYSTSTSKTTVLVGKDVYEFSTCRVYDTLLESQGKLSVYIADIRYCLLLSQPNAVTNLIAIRDVCKYHTVSQGPSKENIPLNVASHNGNGNSSGTGKNTATKPLLQLSRVRGALKPKTRPSSNVGLAAPCPSKGSGTLSKQVGAKTACRSPTLLFTSPTKGSRASPPSKMTKKNTPTPLKSKPASSLSPQQRAVVRACSKGSNVFYSGGAGSVHPFILNY